MASLISILAGNLNSGRSYLITAVQDTLVAGNFFTRNWHAIKRTSFLHKCHSRKKGEQPVVLPQKKTGGKVCCTFFIKNTAPSVNLEIARFKFELLNLVSKHQTI